MFLAGCEPRRKGQAEEARDDYIRGFFFFFLAKTKVGETALVPAPGSTFTKEFMVFLLLLWKIHKTSRLPDKLEGTGQPCHLRTAKD